jgi:hypothetical protein
MELWDPQCNQPKPYDKKLFGVFGIGARAANIFVVLVYIVGFCRSIVVVDLAFVSCRDCMISYCWLIG